MTSDPQDRGRERCSTIADRAARSVSCHHGKAGLVTLVLKRASASRPSGEWNDDDYDVLADSVVIGRIFRGAGSPEGYSVRSPEGPTPPQPSFPIILTCMDRIRELVRRKFLWRIVSLHKRSKVFAGCCIRLKMFQISARPID
jgi:hypothetical protein